MAFSLELQQRIANSLDSKGATKPCARCGNNEFHLIDEFASVTTQKNKGELDFGHGIPVYITVCNNCGNLAFHASNIVTPE